MTAHVQPFVVEAVGAGEGHTRRDRPLLQSQQGLRNLERRARRVGARNGAVEQRAPLVAHHGRHRFAAVASHHVARVVGRRRGHGQNFARRGFDGHDGTVFSLQQALGQLLRAVVDAQREVATRLGLRVILPVHVVALGASVHVAQQNPHALLAAQHFLVAPLHTELTDVVAALIIGVGVHVGLVHLRHVAQQVGRDARGVATHRPLLGRKTVEAKQLFAKLRELVGRNLAHKQLRRVARVARILLRIFDFRHPLHVLLPRDAHRAAEIGRVDAVLVLHRHQDVVRRFVVHEQLPVTVRDQSARGVQDLLAKGVRVGALAVVVAHELERQQPKHKDNNDRQRNAADHKLALLKTIILGHGRWGDEGGEWMRTNRRTVGIPGTARRRVVGERPPSGGRGSATGADA